MTTAPSPSSAVEPLEIVGIRDEIEVREPMSARAWLTILAAAAVAAAAIVLATLDTMSTVGPGQVLSAAIVVVWAACAAFVARRRPDELLGLVMLGIAVLGLLAVGGAVLLGRDGSTDLAVALRAIGVAFLPAAGAYLALSLPDGRVRTRPARVLAALSFALSIGLAIYLYGERPALPAGVLVGVIVVDGLLGVSAFIARDTACRSPSGRASSGWPGA